MKILHWAMIFVVLILPFSILARDTIQKKTLVLQDQTRIDNVLDLSTYDAVNQILEVAEFYATYAEVSNVEEIKHFPIITEDVAMASLDRFFQSMAVNFNLPSNIEVSKEYFGQFIPAILIVGYDGLYVYSYDRVPGVGYQYVLQPKIPYAYYDEDLKATINFTLGNDVKIFLKEELNDKYKLISGQVGNTNDALVNQICIDVESVSGGLTKQREYILTNVANSYTNVSLILKVIQNTGTFNTLFHVPDYLIADDVAQDYEYRVTDNVRIKEASEFHKKRRETIVGLIRNVLREEVNEHETYANLIGVTYDFYIPDISEDDWNNTINDISVLAFFQGMPMGADSYYNNYSLGGARIVKAHSVYAEDNTGRKLYHRHDCPLILMPDPSGSGNMVVDESKYDWEFMTWKDARKEGYWACEECR